MGVAEGGQPAAGVGADRGVRAAKDFGDPLIGQVLVVAQRERRSLLLGEGGEQTPRVAVGPGGRFFVCRGLGQVLDWALALAGAALPLEELVDHDSACVGVGLAGRRDLVPVAKKPLVRRLQEVLGIGCRAGEHHGKAKQRESARPGIRLDGQALPGGHIPTMPDPPPFVASAQGRMPRVGECAK